MKADEKRGVPYRISIEWSGDEDFHFSCDYGFSGEPPDSQRSGEVLEVHHFPHVTRAMGNVLRKLRREHIAFPLFLLSLAFEHRQLLREIDELLRALHAHLAAGRGNGTYRSFITGKKGPVGQ